ncbi:MAG: hypothetical protein M3042_01795 [Actinomycetota bacterium]|nr:hypothetical protein [Actinomycetota bacterium]
MTAAISGPAIRWRGALLPVAMGLAATGLVLWHLFVPTTIGTSDTGDGPRLMCQLNVADLHELPRGANSAQRFVALHYDSVRPPPYCHFRSGIRYPTSAVVVVAAGKVITDWFEPAGGLDMRVVGALYALLYGAAIGLLTLLLPGPTWARGAIAGIFAVLGADGAFVPYFISPYSEPTEYIALLLSICGLLALWRRPVVATWKLILVTLAFAALLTSKTQDVPLIVVLAAALLSVRSPIGRSLTGRLTGRLLPAIAAGALIAVSALTLQLQPRSFNQTLVWSDVFYTILYDSPHPQADLRDLGVPTEMARFAGQTFYQAYPVAHRDPQYQVFLRRVRLSDVALFYIRHPGRMATVAGSAAAAVAHARYDLPNTLRSDSSRPFSVCRICFITRAGEAVSPQTPNRPPTSSGLTNALFPGWLLAVGVAGAVLVRRRWPEREWRAFGLLLVTLPPMALIMFFAAILGDGYAELAKHVFGTVVVTWLAIPLLLLAVVGIAEATVRTCRGGVGGVAIPPWRPPSWCR